MRNKIVLAYSGGLDTSCAIKWLQEQYNYDVIAVTMDVGEGKALEPIRDKALKLGACKAYILPLQDQFTKEFLVPALQGNALYENAYPLCSALSRPLIARSLVDIAIKEGATAIAHGCTGKGNDQIRLDVSIKSLAEHLHIVAPARENPIAREDAIIYAKQHNIPLPIDLNNPFSVDQNLWGRSCECGILEDPSIEPPEAAYALTCELEEAPQSATTLFLQFDQGIPVALNKKADSFKNIITELNQIAGSHGVGRIDLIENRVTGIKSREIYEAPAAITLITAHRALEALTLPKELMQFKPIIEQRFATLIYEGLWFSPLREALYSFIQQTQKRVTGIIKIKLYKGQAIVIGRSSPYSLYVKNLATYTAEDHFDHQAAIGFIKFWGLPTQIYHGAGNDKALNKKHEVSKRLVIEDE